jgi:hypothetical protein
MHADKIQKYPSFPCFFSPILSFSVAKESYCGSGSSRSPKPFVEKTAFLHWLILHFC